jgi:hypothetical protein
MKEFAQAMQWLVDEVYPLAEIIRVVLDNWPPINLPLCMKLSHPKKHDGFSRSWNSITHPNMAVGSTWPRLN